MKGELPSGWYRTGWGSLEGREASLDAEPEGIRVEIQHPSPSVVSYIPPEVMAEALRAAGWTVTPPGGREP